MAEYIATSPNAEVRGQVILGTVNALGERAQKSLAKYGLAQIDPAQWYPQQAWLNVLRDIAQGPDRDFFDLVAIGKASSERAVLPEEVNSAQAALMMMSRTYPLNNRNCSGSVDVEVRAPNHVRVTVRNPYPREMMYGVIWGFASRFERNAIVKYADGTCDSSHESCAYDVTW